MLSFISFLRFRRKVNKRRRQIGKCPNCLSRGKCQDWCRGPKLLTVLGILLNPRLRSHRKIIWRLVKNNWNWAGTEPWHRY